MKELLLQAEEILITLDRAQDFILNWKFEEEKIETLSEEILKKIKEAA